MVALDVPFTQGGGKLLTSVMLVVMLTVGAQAAWVASHTVPLGHTHAPPSRMLPTGHGTHAVPLNTVLFVQLAGSCRLWPTSTTVALVGTDVLVLLRVLMGVLPPRGCVLLVVLPLPDPLYRTRPSVSVQPARTALLSKKPGWVDRAGTPPEYLISLRLGSCMGSDSGFCEVGLWNVAEPSAAFTSVRLSRYLATMDATVLSAWGRGGRRVQGRRGGGGGSQGQIACGRTACRRLQ